ncbi:hypothetical protein [Sphingomonas soli]|uniref:hypothetical protein n=1 Tax=Sphingomonas soli TaxID=266127 RepID=UPI00082DB215|nr:hypothetical protein [Sphingomonas soli]
MAKDKSPKSGSLLPKSIAGAKLPKDIRKKLTDLAKHPVVADILAAGLVALAAKLKNEPKVQQAAAKARTKAADVAADVAEAAAGVAAAVARPTDAPPAAKRVRKPAAPVAKADKPKTPAKPKAPAKAKSTSKPRAAAKPKPAE